MDKEARQNKLVRGPAVFWSPGRGLDLPQNVKDEMGQYLSQYDVIQAAYLICASWPGTIPDGFQLSVRLSGGDHLQVSDDVIALLKRISKDTKRWIEPAHHWGVLIVNNLETAFGPTDSVKYMDLAECIFDRQAC